MRLDVKTIAVAIAIAIGVAVSTRVRIQPYDHGASSPPASLTGPAGNDSPVVRHPRDVVLEHGRNGVIFSDGESLPVLWRKKSGAPADSEKPLGQQYEELVAAASAGSADAAVSLVEITDYCEHSFESQEQVDDAVSFAYQAHRLKTPQMAQPIEISEPEKVEQYIDLLVREPYQRCASLTPAQKQESDHWLRMAADLGDSLAMLEYARLSDDRELREEYLMKSWMAGEADALRLLSQHYGEAYESGESPSNKVLAYAMFLAYERLLDAALQDHGPISHSWLYRNQDRLAEMTIRMHSYEVSQAMRMAKDLIRSNPACCYSM